VQPKTVAAAPVKTVKPVTPPKPAAEKPAALASAPAEPVKLAAVSPSSADAPRKVASTAPAGTGLTTAEKLEMADLAYRLKEYQQSLAIWATLAQAGNAEAQYRLGTLFDDGVAVPVDRVRAYYWWEKAKASGSAAAAEALASLEKSLTHMEKRQIQRTN
jgi:TPR repeat protein